MLTIDLHARSDPEEDGRGTPFADGVATVYVSLYAHCQQASIKRHKGHS